MHSLGRLQSENYVYLAYSREQACQNLLAVAESPTLGTDNKTAAGSNPEAA